MMIENREMREGGQNKHVEKLRMANERIPKKRRIEIDMVLEIAFFARHPSEYHNDRFALTSFVVVLLLPIVISSNSPHLSL